MAKPGQWRRRGIGWAIVVATIVAFVGLQIWASREATRQADRIARETVAAQSISDERSREELIKLRIENEQNTLFWRTFLTSFIPVVTVMVAVLGALPALRSYLAGREKERSDRASEELNEVFKHLVTDNPRERAFGVVGLQHFLEPEQEEFHLRTLTALAAAARVPEEATEADAEVIRSVRIAFEKAARQLPPDLLTRVSWQSANLRGVSLPRWKARGIDLRDAVLRDADLSGADLQDARLDNARLQGANLTGAVLRGAVLEHADLAGATFSGADLGGASMLNAKVWDLKIGGADLKQTRLDPDEFPWQLVPDWRAANLDPPLRQRLIDEYGPEPAGARVLMLMWEIPPLVAGGTWTACYHLVRRLRVEGADVTVVVPWDEALIGRGAAGEVRPFGTEVRVIGLGVETPFEQQTGPYGVSSPYGFVSPYGVAQPFASPYGFLSPYGFAPPLASPYSWMWGSPYAAPAPSLAAAASRSSIVRLTDEFTRRVLRLPELESFDVVHAHDWITFPAAEALAERGLPWVAHFHSTVADRQPDAPDPVIRALEGRGARSAAAIVTPSRLTAERVRELYDVPPEKVTVVPNPLSPERIPLEHMGAFETKRVVFLGRLTRQKGADLFLEVARRFSQDWDDPTRFAVYGAGEDEPGLRSSSPWNVSFMQALEWSVRGEAFARASAVVVPSRAEPFGMVVAEAMQHRVPVLFSRDAGIGEVVDAGIRIDPDDADGTAELLDALLADWSEWEQLVEKQAAAIHRYEREDQVKPLRDLWKAHARSSVAGAVQRPRS